MSKYGAETIKLGSDAMEATILSSGNKVEIYDKEGMDIVYLTKQDLLGMLKLFEQQEQEDNNGTFL